MAEPTFHRIPHCTMPGKQFEIFHFLTAKKQEDTLQGSPSHTPQMVPPFCGWPSHHPTTMAPQNVLERLYVKGTSGEGKGCPGGQHNCFSCHLQGQRGLRIYAPPYNETSPLAHSFLHPLCFHGRWAAEANGGSRHIPFYVSEGVLPAAATRLVCLHHPLF